MIPIGRPTGRKSDDPLVETAYRSNVRAFLDWERGTVRAFRLVRGSRTPTASDDLPFEIELGKPGGDRTFSRDTLELQGAWSCLLDPEDGSFWRVDVLDPSVPLARVELPERDRFVRMEPMYRRDTLAFGRYQEAWEDPAVVGEHGRYTWNGREFVAFDSSGACVPASEAESLLRFRVVIDDPDPIRCTVRVLDAKDDGELFAYSYAPQTALSHAAATAAQAMVFLRSPLANTLISTGVLRRDSELDPTYMARNEFLAGGRRPWLWLLDLGAALLCAGVCARLLRRREVAPIWIGLGSLFVLLFGPVALLVVWLLEPKGRARAIPSAAPLPEPALAIQSA